MIRPHSSSPLALMTLTAVVMASVAGCAKEAPDGGPVATPQSASAPAQEAPTKNDAPADGEEATEAPEPSAVEREPPTKNDDSAPEDREEGETAGAAAGGGKAAAGFEPTGQAQFDEAAWVRPKQKKVKAPKDVKRVPNKGVRWTEAGVAYRIIASGDPDGNNPDEASTVVAHYTGWTTNGRMFDSSLKSGEPGEFRVGALIAGWRDVLTYMRPGDHWLVWIPEELAYKGKPGRPEGMLVFDLELLAIR